MKIDVDIDKFVVELFNIGCIKFGEFKLKSGIISPVYFDMRTLISYPKLMELAGELITKKVSENGTSFDLVCGVPYGAVPLSTTVSIKAGKSMIMKRKDAKSYGTKNLIEGVYKPADRCLVIEDVITTGSSIIETVQSLREHNIVVNHAIVLLDRQQGAVENIRKIGVQVHSILNTDQVLRTLLNVNKLSQFDYDRTTEFLKSSTIPSVICKSNRELDFESRAKLTGNKVAKRLFEIMVEKKSNLCLSADLNSFDEILKMADLTGPHICILKTHIDIVDDFDHAKVAQLVELSRRHNFLIFEDRKFADIGNTVKSQYTQGMYRISSWAHIVNSHSICGSASLKGFKTDDDEKGLLLIGQLSSKGNLIDENYTKETVKMAEDNADLVIGFICQKRLSENPVFVHIAPGINISQSGDSLGQEYTTPQVSIIDHKCDIIVVGRGIIANADPLAASVQYKNAAFDAYLKRIHS